MEDLLVGDLVIPAEDLEERFVTSGGPGGQHANRSETAVRLRLDIAASSLPPEVKSKLIPRLGEVVEVSAGESRSQHHNRETARSRLAERIQAGLVEQRPRRPTKPSRKARRRRLAAKRARSETKRLRRPPHSED